MPYQQLTIQTTSEHVENITNFLYLFDAVAVTMQDAADQPVLEPELNTTPIWQDTFIKALFQQTISANQIIEFLRKQCGSDAIINFVSEIIDDEDWERAWLKDFRPMQFGKNLWICPSVFTPPHPEAVNIILDPGLAFGTGTHPTTALCLEWLDANPPQDKVVIDYGCGSGILAIAALKLGAKEVFAVDHDPQALSATLSNAERNQVDSSKLHVLLPEQFSAIKADVLLANILANPLIELAPLFSQFVVSQGKLVLSGILQEQAETVATAYREYFTVHPCVQKEEWIRLDGVKN